MVHSLPSTFSHITPVYHNQSSPSQFIYRQYFAQSHSPHEQATLGGTFDLQMLLQGKDISIIQIED